MSQAAILIVTNERDVGADFLVRELANRDVPVVRLNSERATEWRLSLEPGNSWRVADETRTLASSECRGVWWRRPEVPQPPTHTATAIEAVADQWRAFLAALATVPGPIWISDPPRIRAAENKALQLQVARRLGFDVPRTVWTNGLDQIREFLASCNDLVAVKSPTSAWWEESDGARFVYTSLVSSDELPDAGRLAQAPVVVQQPIVPKRDVRVTVVEKTVLAAIRDTGAEDPSEPIDWRHAPQHPWAHHKIPAEIADRCRDLVRAFDLRFGAIDLALDGSGKHWFLELNPNGEWGWLQRIGLPIAEALADSLTSCEAVRE